MDRMNREILTGLLYHLIEDAAAYMHNKVVNEVLNGQPGESYPKSYPGSITPGAKGFVGVVTGNLKRAIQTRKVSQLQSNVILDGSASYISVTSSGYNNYGEIVAKWAEKKYGFNYFDIAVRLYGPLVQSIITETLKRFVRAVTDGVRFQYKNPFPA